MEKLNRDELFVLALEMDAPSILNLCRTNKRFQEKLCKNDDVWRYKLLKEYYISSSKNPKQEYLKLSSLSTVFWTKVITDEKIVKLWVDNLDKLLEIFEKHYPRRHAPEWVNYDLFRNTKLVEMFEVLQESDIDDNIDMVFALPVAYGSSYLDTGASWFVNPITDNMDILFDSENFKF